MKSTRPAPFGHKVPRFTGWSGSPSICRMLDWAFFAASPRLYMITPQATAQYGQVLRVSVARDNLNSRTSASATEGENPMRARLEPAKVEPVTARKRRRVIAAMATSDKGMYGAV